jgi:raffinose/stachyose/melibiose transport system permease protein
MGAFRYTWKTLSREVVVLGIALLWVVPFYFLVLISLKGGADIYSSPFKPPTDPSVHAYSQAWKGTPQASFPRGLLSSVIITSGSVLALIAIGSLSAYTLNRLPGKLSVALFLVFVFGLILPVQLGLIPIFVAMRDLHLIGTYAGMIILYTGLLMPLSVFLYTGFVRALPRDYEEAAQVDGARPFRVFRKVVFPLLRPVTGTVAILCGLIIWNDFFTPLVFLSGTGKATLPVVVYSFVGGLAQQWNVIFAAVALSILPLLAFYVIAQRQLIQGFSGGIKT